MLRARRAPFHHDGSFSPPPLPLYTSPILEAVALAGTHATRCRDFTRLSAFSRYHPCARAAAASALTVDPATAASTSFVNTHRGHAGGARGEEGESSAGPRPEVLLFLPGLSSGGGSADAARNHTEFAVQSDGTAGKLFGDLGGSVEGVTFTHVSLSRGRRRRGWRGCVV